MQGGIKLVIAAHGDNDAEVWVDLIRHAFQLGDNEVASLEMLERRHVLAVCESTNYCMTASARLLGIDRRTLYRKLETWEVEINRGFEPRRRLVSTQRSEVPALVSDGSAPAPRVIVIRR